MKGILGVLTGKLFQVGEVDGAESDPLAGQEPSGSRQRDGKAEEAEETAEYNRRLFATFSDDPPHSTTRVNSHVLPSETAKVERSCPIAIATSAEPPLESSIGGAPRHGGPIHLRGYGRGWVVPLPALGGHLVVTGPPLEHDPARGLMFIGAVLVALALASIPLARSISRPLETLTATSRRLGAGDLSARANLRARGEVGELGRSFDEMAGRLEALVRGERELLANVSHELRTPLARMRVALELAAEGDRERAQRHLAEIGADLEELDALIDDVLTAARLDARGAGAWPIAHDPVDLATVVREAAQRFRGTLLDRTLEVEIDPAAPNASGDAALLRRLLGILLDNAAKYSDAPAPVTLALRRGTNGAALEVRGRGIGIEAAALPRLFTPFFRTERSRARATRGTGLGLALARRIAGAHGGTILAESVPGAGTTFRVELPEAPSSRE